MRTGCGHRPEILPAFRARAPPVSCRAVLCLGTRTKTSGPGPGPNSDSTRLPSSRCVLSIDALWAAFWAPRTHRDRGGDEGPVLVDGGASRGRGSRTKAQNNISKFLQCCLKCCFWCLETVVKFLNRNAYIMIAIYGKNFCKSAREAFNLLMRNVLKVAVMDNVTDFVLILGKILVTGCIGVLAFLLFTQRLPTIIEGPTSLNYYWVPLLTVIIGSYLVAHGFFSVYAMCVDTIFICFLEDMERNDGSTERPYYMSQSLLKILNEPSMQTKKP